MSTEKYSFEPPPPYSSTTKGTKFRNPFKNLFKRKEKEPEAPVLIINPVLIVETSKKIITQLEKDHGALVLALAFVFFVLILISLITALVTAISVIVTTVTVVSIVALILGAGMAVKDRHQFRRIYKKFLKKLEKAV